MEEIDSLGLFKAGVLYDKVRHRLQDRTISDCTIRRWRAQAFVERQSVYTEATVTQIVEYALILFQVGTVDAARTQYAQILDARKESSLNDQPQCIDVESEVVA